MYNCTSGTLQRQTWGDVTTTMHELILSHPLPHVMRYPSVGLTRSRLCHSISLLCLHYLPALALDLGLQLVGRKPRWGVTRLFAVCSGPRPVRGNKIWVRK